jgi:preprotein translocase subunit SecE
MNDRIKFAVGAVLVALGLAAYYVLADYPLVVRVLAVLAGLALGALVSWSTQQGQDFRGFAKEAWLEARRVVWPSRKETWQTTGVVFAMVLVMGLFLWFVDLGIGMVVSRLLGHSE